MSSNDQFSGSYRDANVHAMMIHDVVRTEAYERALMQAVTKGCKVLDFGCGSGVLSIFASRAGADTVYAVDKSIFIEKALSIAKCNNIENILFYHNDHKDLELETKVDILVSEWMGHFLFYESMLGPLLHVRDKYLKAGGVMIPGSVSLHGGLVTDEYYFEDSSFLRQNPYGIDFSPIADAPLFQTPLENITEKQILKDTIDLGTFDLHTLEAPPKKMGGSIVPKEKATVYGCCGWFSAKLSKGIGFGTGPFDPPTHWNQIYFSLDEPLEIKPGKELTLSITLPDDDSKHEPAWFWKVTHGTKTIELNDAKNRESLNPFLPSGLINDKR